MTSSDRQTPDPRIRVTGVGFRPAQLARLDRMAKRHDTSRSQLIRRAVEMLLAGEGEHEPPEHPKARRTM
jgi:metal-responsive CopG/Arc/MetJ family transcriptional regulator